MAITVPHMGLRLWNLGQDPYNSQQLADNFAKIDQHDHAPGRGRQLGTGALQDGSVTASKLAANSVGSSTIADGSVTAAKLATNSVTTPKIADNAVTFAKLGSDANTDWEYAYSAWKSVGGSFDAVLTPSVVTAAATYVIVPAVAVSSGVVARTSSPSYAGLFYLNPADWSAGSRTANLRLKVSFATAGIAPGQDITFGLYPVIGVSSGIVSLNTVTTGSTALIAGSTTFNANAPVTSSSFVAPASGAYAIGFTSAGAFAASSAIVARVQLQMKQV